MIDLAYRPFSLSLAEPLETAHGAIEAREGFLVRVTDDESEGVGEATPLPGWTESIEDCDRALEEAAETVREKGLEAAFETGSGAPAARHGLSLAAVDRAASEADRPLYRHLGGGERVDRVPVNATVGDGSPAETADAVRDAVDRGFSCCKLKVGVKEVERDVARVQRVREAVGPDPELRLDANGAWSRAEADRVVEALAGEIGLLEQPLPAEDLGGHADLRGRGVDIAIDEGLYEGGIDDVVDRGAADAVVLKPMAVGGVDAAIKLAVWVRECGISPIVTTTVDGVLARTAAVHLAAAIPKPVDGERPAGGLATADLLASDLAADPVAIEGGKATVPQDPGLGVADTWGGRDA